MHLLGPLVVGLLPGIVHLLGEQPCPDRAAVEAELRLIAPGVSDSGAGTGAAGGRLALVELEPKGLRVKLFDSGGHLLQDRFVEGSDTCHAWAKVAAALIATWEIHLGELHVEESPPSVLAAPSVPASPPAERARDLFVEIGLGLGPTAALAGTGSTTVGGEAFFGLRPRSLPLGLELGVATSASRLFPVSGGNVAWERFSGSLGGYGVFGARELQLELGAAFLGSFIEASTRGSLSPRSATNFDAGLGISTRLRWKFARNWNAWVRGGTALWLQSEVLAGAAATTVDLPSVDLYAMFGLSLVLNL